MSKLLGFVVVFATSFVITLIAGLCLYYFGKEGDRDE